MPKRVRLHISPLNPELLPAVLPPPVLATVSGISYHTIQTFTERNYGYVELPAMEAEKIQKKLNGSILKGSKMRVEKARPEKKEKIPKEGDPQTQEDETDKTTRKSGRKRKREDGVLPGFELPKERKVKRGWTEPLTESRDKKVKKGRKDAKDSKAKKAKLRPSSFREKPECLFRTKLPLNKERVDDSKLAPQHKPKKRKDGIANREATVHEFSNTTKHAGFLRDNQALSGKTAVSEYIEGKGWVDKDGKIVEQAVTSSKRRSSLQIDKPANQKESSSLGLKSSKLKSIEEHPTKKTPDKPIEETDETSSSGVSSSSEDDDESNKDENLASEPNMTKPAIQKPFQSSASATSLTNDINKKENNAATSSATSNSSPPPITSVTLTPTQPSPNVHPREALFKRPQSTSTTPRKPNLEVQTSFSFFDPDPDPNPDNPTLHHPIPQTPFTAQDTQQRRMRSAAPTPDTAAPGKAGFGPLWGINENENENEDGEQDEDGEEETENEVDKKNKKVLQANENDRKEKGKVEGDADGERESAFVKWFWEHRGENNRAWKRRRREAGKEKRQRENRQRGKDVV